MIKKIMFFALWALFAIGAIVQDASANRRLSDNDYFAIIAEQSRSASSFGKVPNTEVFTALGTNVDVDTGTAEIIRPAGGTGLPFRTAASTISVVSASASDALAGIGGNVLRIYGLDSNYLSITEDINLNGTTPVVTTKSFIAMNRAALLLSGTSQTNVGAITLTYSSDSAVAGTMPVGHGFTHDMVYTMAADKVGFIDSLIMEAAKPGAGSDPEVVFNVMVYSPFTNTYYEISHHAYTASTSVKSYDEFKMEPFNPKETIWVKMSTTQNDSVASVRMNLKISDYPAR